MDLAELDAQRDRLLDGGREAEPSLVEIDHIGPAALGAVEMLESVDRIAPLGRHREHLLPGGDRVVGAVQRDVERRGLDQGADAILDIGACRVGLLTF